MSEPTTPRSDDEVTDERPALKCLIEGTRCMGPTTSNMVVTVLGNVCFPCFAENMAERVAPYFRMGVLLDD